MFLNFFFTPKSLWDNPLKKNFVAFFLIFREHCGRPLQTGYMMGHTDLANASHYFSLLMMLDERFCHFSSTSLLIFKHLIAMLQSHLGPPIL